jgi:hypothetical protein
MRALDSRGADEIGLGWTGSEERSFAALKMTTKDEGNGDVNGAQLKSLCGNSDVFVGRGFSHDVNIARSARLHSLRKNARNLVLRG